MDGKLSTTTFILMLIFALLADGASFFISLVPIVGQVANPVIAFIVSLTFWLWFAMNGLGFKGGLGAGASMVVEIIPVVQMLPPFTALVVALYIRNRVIDKVPVAGKVVGSIKPRAIASASLKKAA